MLLKAIGLIARVASGFGLAQSTFRVDIRVAILTALLAAIAQAGLRFVLPHEVIERMAQSHLYDASGQIRVMALVIVETAGLLLPVASMPWTCLSSRAWTTLYVLGAGFLAAATYYFPFDVVIVDGKVSGPTHPSYELVLVFSLPIGAIGFLVGWLARRQRIAAERRRTATRQ